MKIVHQYESDSLEMLCQVQYCYVKLTRTIQFLSLFVRFFFLHTCSILICASFVLAHKSCFYEESSNAYVITNYAAAKMFEALASLQN